MYILYHVDNYVLNMYIYIIYIYEIKIASVTAEKYYFKKSTFDPNSYVFLLKTTLIYIYICVCVCMWLELYKHYPTQKYPRCLVKRRLDFVWAKFAKAHLTHLGSRNFCRGGCFSRKAGNF